jgi:hypothetical protein
MKKNKVAPVIILTLTGLEATCLSEGIGLDEAIPTGDMIISMTGVNAVGAISTIH